MQNCQEPYGLVALFDLLRGRTWVQIPPLPLMQAKKKRRDTDKAIQ